MADVPMSDRPMSDRQPTPVSRRFSYLSTATKLLIILALCLLPLGLVALLASVDAARDGRAEREALARVNAVRSATALSSLVLRDTLALRIVAQSASGPGGVAGACMLLDRIASDEREILLSRYALFDRGGRRLCGTGDLRAETVSPGIVGASIVRLDPAVRELRFEVAASDARAVGVLDHSVLLAAASRPSDGRAIDVRLQQGPRSLQLIDRYDQAMLQRTVVSRARLGRSDVFAVASVGAIPISAAEIATILLPLLMWFVAAALGWLIVDRLLLRPIVAMQKAVLAYRPGGAPFDLPRIVTPATEIRDLGDAFTRVTGTVAAHEAELEAAIARQARLVREVHHRVKNNLQVVASLLNLHARGAKSAEASAAYATIQRRVDALSVVHRNHFAELEDDRGVALRSLLSELTGNLRATAPDEAAKMSITLDLDTLHANQDVAVSVAFFVTEVVEHAMLCTPHAPVGVSLRQGATPTSARLTLTSASLRADEDCDGRDIRQFERITTGLSRQLRSPLHKDGEVGVFTIDITVQAAPSD